LTTRYSSSRPTSAFNQKKSIIGEGPIAPSPKNFMYFVYILRSKRDNHKYIGVTKNLENRLLQHNSSQVESTKHRRPLEVVGYRVFDTIYEALIHERKYKNSHGQLERDIKNGKITLTEKY